MIRTLFYRADTVATNPEDPTKRNRTCQISPTPMRLQELEFQQTCTKKQPKVADNTDSTKSTKHKTFVVTPYVQGVSEKVKQVFSSYSISMCFKPHQTLRQIFVAPKDKTKIEDQTGVVYHIPCGGCNKVYVGETK